MRKIFVILMLIIFILSVNVCFADNATDIYVSNNGSDSFGDGSQSNPYKTLDYSIGKSSDNSSIYLESGTYEVSSDINKSLSIKGIGDVSISGANNQKMFMISQDSSLRLENIKFINGWADLEGGLLSPIINEGNLFISNSTFNNFTTIMGAVKNLNHLTMDNVTAANLDHSTVNGGAHFSYSSPYGKFVTNAGELHILNSNVFSSIYNNADLYMNSTYVDIYLTGKDYADRNVTAFIDRSLLMKFTVRNATLLSISNSVIDCEEYHTFSGNISLFNTTFSLNKKPTYLLDFDKVNLTAVSCVFNNQVRFASYSNVNITYSTFLDYVSTNYYSSIYLNHNWWADNRGPKIHRNAYSSITADDWIVMTLSNESDQIIKVDFTHVTNGGNIMDLENPELFTPRFVTMDSESGHFSRPTGYLESGTFITALLDANVDTILHATVDGQVLRLAMGEGLTNYTVYVSDSLGNDYFYDGSAEYPFKTLRKAISAAFSGNTIYVNEGIYTLSWNANLRIYKNLTFEGLGEAVLARPNNRNIFIVDDKGELTLKNLTFTTYTNDGYSNPLILMNGGILNIKDSIFKSIRHTDGVISTVKDGIRISLDNVTFDSIVGAAVHGNATHILINNSRFTNGLDSNLDEGSYISVHSDVTILNSLFANSTQSMVSINRQGHFARTYSIHISNSSFIDNNWQKKDYFGLAIGVGRYFSMRYSVIDNCSFINNTGHLIFANIINNSVFINNSAISFDDEFTQPSVANIYPKSLIEAAELINNSYFEGNSYTSKSYEDKVVYSPNVYHSTFIGNRAAFGGALNNASNVHYCVFVNNSAVYGGNDIFLYNGNLDATSNWWGSNQKPDDSRIQVFIGNLIIDDWVVMTLEVTDAQVKACLNTLLDDNRNHYELNHTLPTRGVVFTSLGGEVTPNPTVLVDNVALANLIKNTTLDFDVFAQIDNQIMSLTVYNNSTQLIIKNQTFYGKGNQFNITLINVNGHRISNQDLNVVITSNGETVDSFTLRTDADGQTGIDISYPVGIYEIAVRYLGNGYFEATSNRAVISVSSIETRLSSFNYTYWGKNNRFYGILTDSNGRYILNENLILKTYDMNGNLLSTSNVMTGNGGRADVLLSLDTGRYRLTWDYIGNEWYSSSSSESFIEIKPINTTIALPSVTLYGKGNDYELTFRDGYGTLISDEIISLKIYNRTDSNVFSLTTVNGVASININLLPGVYNLEATYKGDDVYGASSATATLTIKPVFVTFDFNSHPEIPINGVFTVIVKDMYGKKVSGESVTLELYDDGLVKTYTAVSDAAGEANFKIDAGEGIYFGIIGYGGNTWYESSTGAATITVSRDVMISNIYISGSDFVAYYGENKYYTIDFNDTNAYNLEDKIINVLISSKSWSKSFEVPSDIFGKARLQITLDPGVYNITYRYSNDYYNIYGEGSNSIVIYRMPTSLIASNMVVNIGQSRNMEVKLVNYRGNPLSNLPVKITVDGVEHNVTTNSAGIAKVLVDLGLGLHNVSYSFEGKNYESSSGEMTVMVVDSDKTETRLEASVQDSTLKVLLTDIVGNPISSSEVLVNISGEVMRAYTDSSGVASFNLNLAHGDYVAHVSYLGNSANLESYCMANVHIKAFENVTETMLYGQDCEIINGDGSTNYFVVLTTIDGEFISNRTVVFKVKNQTYSVKTNEFGRAGLDVPFTPGSYEVTASFEGSSNLTRASIVNYISVSGNVVNMYSQDIVKTFNNATHYFVSLTDANNMPLAGKTIEFYVNGRVYKDVTDSEGFACFEVWLDPGVYEITARYAGKYADEVAFVKNSITVLSTIVADSMEVYGEGSQIITAFFVDYNDEVLKNTKVYFVYNNQVYTPKTDEFGIALLSLDLKSGTHRIIAVNPATYENMTFTVKILPTVVSKNVVKYFTKYTKFTATFKDSSGNLLKNKKVRFTVNKRTYTVKTDKNGKASVKVKLMPGKYAVYSYNPVTGENHANKITIKPTIVAKNKVVKAFKKTNFKIKVLNSKGKILKKVKVKVKVAKKVYTLKTNKKGIATLNIKLKKGNYKVISSYGGLRAVNKIKVVR